MKAARKRGRQAKRLVKRELVPGMTPLPEDSAHVTGGFRLPKQPARQSAPLYRGGEPSISRREVEDRLLRAMQTLRSVPDRERRFFIVKSNAPEYVQEYIDAYASVEVSAPKFRPSPEDVSDYLNVLMWVRHLPKNSWNILWWRSFGLSFGVIAEYIGRSDETARTRYKEALTDAWMAATGLTGKLANLEQPGGGRTSKPTRLAG